MRKAHRDGQSLREIARRYRCDVSVVQRLIREETP
jgi:Mor family transcriptional regulator